MAALVAKVLGDMTPKFLGFIEKTMPNGGVKQSSIYNVLKRDAAKFSAASFFLVNDAKRAWRGHGNSSDTYQHKQNEQS